MPRTSSLFLLTALVALAAPAAQAQSAAPASAAPPAAAATPAADTATSPVFTPAAADQPLPAVHLPPPEDDHGDPRRIQSSDLTNAVVNGMPKYDPPKPVAAKPADSDADKPKNGIIRLPKYVVRDRKPPIFTDKDVMTDKEKADLAMKKYVGLDPSGANGFVAGSERVLFQGYANQEYADAERAGNISSLRTDASVSSAGGDKAESDFIKQQSNDTYMRHMDWTDSVPTGRPDASTPR